MRTQVGIVGAGPAGLVLSHLLARAGIDNVVVDNRSRDVIEQTVRAGILEPGTVALMTSTGVGDRVLAQGQRHDGIELRFAGENRRIDLVALTGHPVWLYPQHEVLTDLIAARLAAGGDLRFACSDVALDGLTTEPLISFTDAEGVAQQVSCDVVVGCDGSGGVSRAAIPAEQRTERFRAYPFGWFGILVEAPPSSHELIYAHSDRGFALISTRTPELQRMYFQCDPQAQVSQWSDEQVWDELAARTAFDGFSLKPGPIVARSVLPMRSFVCEPMRYGQLFLAGDAAHTVPPTGAKGLNLAVADVRVLARALQTWYTSGDCGLLDTYSQTALRRVWKTQHFSWWMTSMLHTREDATPFDVRRQQGELDLVTSSTSGARYLAEAYVGWPDSDA